MRTYVLCAVLISLVPTALANAGIDAITWSTADGADLCAGYINACDSMKSCSAIAFGPCANTTVKPSWALSSYVEGLAFVDQATYLGCTDTTDCATKIKIVNLLDHDNNGYRDLDEIVVGDGKYGFMQTGAVFGNLATVGAYVGSAWYFNTGTTTLKTNTNLFYVATSDGAARVIRGSSTIAAPNGPYEMCIADKTGDGTSCGAEREYAPGYLKFSAYGYTAGPNYATHTVAGTNGFPDPTTHFAMRTRVDAHGIEFADIKLNDDKTIDDIGDVSVTKITLTKQDGEGIDMDFPTTYNIKQAGGGDCGLATHTVKVCLPTATKTVKIKVSLVAGVQAIYIDYLFEAGDFMGADSMGAVFVYDPTIKRSAPAGNAGTASATTTPVPVLATATLSASSMPLILVLMLCSVLFST